MFLARIRVIAACVGLIFGIQCGETGPTEQTAETIPMRSRAPEPIGSQSQLDSIVALRPQIFLCFYDDQTVKLKESDAECANRANFSAKANEILDQFWVQAYEHWEKYQSGSEGTAQEYGDETENLMRQADHSVSDLGLCKIETPYGDRLITHDEAEEIIGYLSHRAMDVIGSKKHMNRKAND